MKQWIRVVRTAAAVCVAAVVSVLSCAVPAQAADQLIPVPENGTPGLLWLSSSVYPLAFPQLAPGDSFVWQIGLSLEKPEATSSLQLTATGTLAAANGYAIAVDECPTPWQGDSGLNQRLECPAGSTPRVPTTRLGDWDQALRIPLSNLRAGTSPYLRFTLAGPAGDAPPEGATLTLGIGISAMGDDDGASAPSQPPVAGGGSKEPLGNTGASSLPALFAGGALLLLGTAVLALVKRPRETTEQST
ncbi:LPXTG cell wall anchor domain-containing protein [Paenarthrobacter sp. JL.01a]|uniref:LPXTG cell wall anchor domain-containing protein n=1 Tax=Paenarthrobacter sp. JL.01a TaxID=2979324 RepID=UPI0021C95DB8|nr:LPXTG cell wall anchor domain-containing protein [Paenarthrobacter sp. JL.01a]UXM92226.1 LPXTG cell wall anchor domain-containing protein [Paenarthrobacter sp. JL.01a]